MAKSLLQIKTDNLKKKIALNIEKQVQDVSRKIVKKASYALFDHIKEEASKKLHKRKKFYLNNLEIKEISGLGGYRILLRKPAGWIEHGLDERQLRDDFLSSGKKRRVIPLSDGELTGTNKARKVRGAEKVTFRTMTAGQPANMWKTSIVKGVEIFKSSKKWFSEQLKKKDFLK